jgi:hypothetical protein
VVLQAHSIDALNQAGSPPQGGRPAFTFYSRRTSKTPVYTDGGIFPWWRQSRHPVSQQARFTCTGNANPTVTNLFLKPNGTINNLNGFGTVSGARDPRIMQLGDAVRVLRKDLPCY